jgi:hypothetical protein
MMHIFESKCWDDDAPHMWKRKIGIPLKKTTVEIPRWVKMEYGNYFPHKIPYKIKFI